MKFLKRSLILLLVLSLLVPLIVFVLTRFYKQEIADAMVANLNDRFSLNLKVEDVDVSVFSDFPHASVSLRNVVLDNALHPGPEPLLRAGLVNVSFNLRKLLDKKFEVTSVAVHTASLNLLVMENGTRNFEFARKDSAASPAAGIDFDIHKIRISDTHFDFRNAIRGQHIALKLPDANIQLKRQSEGFDFRLTSDAEIAGLLFNPAKGAFLEHAKAKLKLEGSLFTVNKTCFIHDPSVVEINGFRYSTNAFIRLGTERSLALRIKARNLPYANGKKLLNVTMRKQLANYTLSKPVDAELTLFTALGRQQEPALVVRLGSVGNEISIGNSKVTYHDVSFKGLIVSLDTSYSKGNAELARVVFSNIRGNIYNVPFTASVNVRNFVDPYVSIRALLNIEAEKVKLKATEEFDLRGRCVARLSYSGPASSINKDHFLDTQMKLKADLSLKNFSYKERAKPYVYTLNGRASVTNTDLSFSGLVLHTNGGELTLNGKVASFTPYVLGLGNSLGINLEAYSKQLDLNPLMKKTTAAPAKSGTGEAVRQLDDESRFDFNVLLRARRMLVRKVEANDVVMDLAYKNSVLNLRSVTMATCGGQLRFSGSIDHLHDIKAAFDARNINVATLFEQFENFGQDAIKADQLKGSISLNAVFNAELDEKMEIVPYTMLGDVDLTLKEGHLLEYEPLQNVSNFIFHNRDFNDISFSEINERFHVKGYEMQIEELEIASNILNLFVSGTYHFKSHSNINLVIPWSNLRRRGKHYIPKASGLDAEDAKGLKLNYAGKPKNMKLSLGHK